MTNAKRSLSNICREKATNTHARTHARITYGNGREPTDIPTSSPGIQHLCFILFRFIYFFLCRWLSKIYNYCERIKWWLRNEKNVGEEIRKRARVSSRENLSEKGAEEGQTCIDEVKNKVKSTNNTITNKNNSTTEWKRLTQMKLFESCSHELCAHHIIIIKKFHFHFNRHNINFVAFRFNKFIWVSVWLYFPVRWALCSNAY